MASSASTSHVNALQTKHAGLDDRLHQEMSRPAPDDATIKKLKREKLRIKQEIAQIH